MVENLKEVRILISYEDAKSSGIVKYFTGEKCKNGHLDYRYTNTKICYTCKVRRNQRNIKNNPDVHEKIRKKTYLKNKKKNVLRSLMWSKKNPDKRKAIIKRNKEKDY